MRRLRQALRAKLEGEADKLDSGQRARIEGVARSLANRCELTLEAWRAMLRGLHNDPDPAFVDWFAIERIQQREIDVGMYRHYLDPTEPFVNAVIRPSHGAVITSATLRDSLGVPAAANDEDIEGLADWTVAEARTGTRHLSFPAMRAAMASPFDYPEATKVLIVRDVKRDDADQVAAAYRELFLASGGGALGLFTAIGRLRAVHQRIAPALEEAGLPLYAQHVGGMDAATLVDIFRAEEHSCLLGTDAVRDGVDVPGRSLRLIVFDRVPWPRPDILHRARKEAWKKAGAGANAYDDMLARLQAQAGVRPADPPCRRSRRVRDAGFASADAAVGGVSARRQHRAGGPGRCGGRGEGLSRSPGILSEGSHAAHGDDEILSAALRMALNCQRPCPLETCGLTQWSLNRSVALRSSRDG